MPTMSATPTTQPTTIPAMAPPDRLDELDDAKLLKLELELDDEDGGGFGVEGEVAMS